MDKLIHFLESIHPMSDELKAHLQTTLKKRGIKQKEYLLKAGNVSRHACFVLTGLLRCFYVKNGVEVSSSFMKEGDVVFAIKSFYTQTTSYESIQALEDTQVLYIEHEELEYIYKHFSEFNFIGRIITIHYHTLWAEQLYYIRMTPGRERYQWLLGNHTDLLQRVPAMYLCSYLGITEVTLSRLKRQSLLK